MTAVKEPDMVYRLLDGHAGRGRPEGCKPILMVMHIQEGMNDLPSYFASLSANGPNAADSTLWVKLDGSVVRMLNDEDTAWTNGSWDRPNLTNPVIRDLYNRGIYSGDVSLTIEHQGFAGQAFPAAQIEATARMCAYWSVRWGIPADRNHIIGHYELGPHKGCPGATFPFAKLVARTQEIIRMNQDPNPLKLSVGDGMLAKLKEIGQTALTPERYTSDTTSQLVATGGYVLFACKTATGPEWPVVAVKGQ